MNFYDAEAKAASTRYLRRVLGGLKILTTRRKTNLKDKKEVVFNNKTYVANRQHHNL